MHKKFIVQLKWWKTAETRSCVFFLSIQWTLWTLIFVFEINVLKMPVSGERYLSLTSKRQQTSDVMLCRILLILMCTSVFGSREQNTERHDTIIGIAHRIQIFSSLNDFSCISSVKGVWPIAGVVRIAQKDGTLLSQS